MAGMRLNGGQKLSCEGLHRYAEEFIVRVQKQGKKVIRSVCYTCSGYSMKNKL